MTRLVRSVLAIAARFDGTIMSEARRQAAAAFDMSVVIALTMLGSLLVAGSVLLVATQAWRAASVVVGLVYSTTGSLNALGTIGAAMLFAGAAAFVRWRRGRGAVAMRAEVMVPTTDPTFP